MEEESRWVNLDVAGDVANQGEYWVAKVRNFPVIAFGLTRDEAIWRSYDSVRMLCQYHSESLDSLRAYLERRGVENFTILEGSSLDSRPYTSEVMVPVGVR